MVTETDIVVVDNRIHEICRELKCEEAVSSTGKTSFTHRTASDWMML